MIKRITLTASIIILSATILFAQSADLILQKNITLEYIAYLASKEAGYLDEVQDGVDDTPTMKAHMGLAILQAAWTHVNGDTLVNDLDYLLDDIDDNAENVISQISTDLSPLLQASDQNEFFDSLVVFFESGTYPALRDSVNTWLENIENDFGEIGDAIEYFGDKTDPLAEMFGDHWDAVANGTADFEYSVQMLGTEYEDTLFIFSRKFFDRIENIKSLSESAGNTIGDGFEAMLDTLNNNSDQITPAVNTIRAGLDTLDFLVDTLQVFLSAQPFAPFEFDLSGLDSLQSMIAEFDTLLGGKEYPIGPKAESKTIKPLAIIKSLSNSDGIWGVYQDFYRHGEPIDFTFEDIFPHGITSDMLAMIRSDAVLNSNDTFDQFESRVHQLQADWQDNSPIAPDEHLGIALTLIFDLLTDSAYFQQYEQAFRFISEGRLDSLTYEYTWDSFDRHDQLAEIRFHLDQYLDADVVTNFVLLVKEDEDGLGRYTISEESQFSINYLTVPQVQAMTASMELFIDGLSMIAEGMTILYNDLNEIIVLELNPTVLDFSAAESELEYILILEQSNPDFLSLTPHGVDKFRELGDWFEEAFEQVGMFFDNMTRLAQAIEPYEDDFNLDASEMESSMSLSSDLAWEIYEDFAYPDSTTWLDERVNLSAWFDNPPESFLRMWKSFVVGSDSTLGGLFPDRYRETGTHELPVLPTKFTVHPVYPNPFNPTATIRFDLPRTADIRLTIINATGEVVAELLRGRFKAGQIVAHWNAENYPSGVYFGRLAIDGRISTLKMTLLK